MLSEPIKVGVNLELFFKNIPTHITIPIHEITLPQVCDELKKVWNKEGTKGDHYEDENIVMWLTGWAIRV